ncbi:DUF945 family protein [Vibrio sp. MA40-2]|uniref:DUF945 family protein n=1 Tax=Vibrio sp. MA40-2 TaxID=3391828 RepID=UPI0039A4BF80
MQQIKKFGAVGGVLVLVACWPLAVGQIAQKVLTDGIAAINNEQFTAEVVDYDRHYLSALATTRYEIIDPTLKQQFINDGLPTVFNLKHSIQHGVIKVDSVTEFVDFDQIPARLSSVTQLNGNTHFTLDIDNINYPIPDTLNSSIYVAASKIQGKATVLGEVDVTFDIPTVQLHFDSGESWNISSITGSAKGKKDNSFWQGEQQINIADFALLSPDGGVEASATNFSYKFSSSTDHNEQRLDTNHVITVEHMVSNQGELDSAKFDFTLGYLDKNAFEGLVGLYQSNAAIDNAVIAKSTPLIDQLFDRGFKIKLNELNITQGKGVFRLDWLLEIPQGTSNVSQDFSKVIPAFTGDFTGYISNELIESYPHMQEGVDELVIMEFIQPDENGYKSDAKILNGKIVFTNGQEIPLMMLLMSMM